VVVLPHAVVVLDGATSLEPTTRDGGWYAEHLSAELRRQLEERPDADLARLLASAITSVATEHGLAPGSSPSSTAALLRWDEDTVEALVLADSPVVAFTADGARVLADDRLAEVPARPRPGYRSRLRSGGGYGDGHSAALRASAAEVGRWRNREGGFWVAEAEPGAAYQAMRASWPRHQLRSVIVLSDGVSCGVEEYGILPDWNALLDLALASGPQAVVDAVWDAEKSDPDGMRWPRPKRHDDKSLVLVRFDS
jgi:hypothetical protein